MELRLKDYGTIEITKATLVDGGDILVETADNFREIAKDTQYEITEVYLTNTEYGWGVIALLDVPEADCFVDDAIIFDVEDQNSIYKLKAFL